AWCSLRAACKYISLHSNYFQSPRNAFTLAFRKPSRNIMPILLFFQLNSLVDYQIPLLRVYRKYDRTLQAENDFYGIQHFKSLRYLNFRLIFLYL
ncbi:hypothetical protein L9F63_019243, partial [Diploptera punctata]